MSIESQPRVGRLLEYIEGETHRDEAEKFLTLFKMLLVVLSRHRRFHTSGGCEPDCPVAAMAETLEVEGGGSSGPASAIAPQEPEL